MGNMVWSQSLEPGMERYDYQGLIIMLQFILSLCHFMPVIAKWNIFEIFSFSFFCTIGHIFSGLWKGENKEFIS